MMMPAEQNDVFKGEAVNFLELWFNDKKADNSKVYIRTYDTIHEANWKKKSNWNNDIIVQQSKTQQ